MPLYTCITCQVGFHDPEIQRQHYKTDWHRYNLKRKVAELPPVTAEAFSSKVIAQKEKATEDAKNAAKSVCALCNKHFSNKNSYDNHLNSKRHKEAEAKSTGLSSDQVQEKNATNLTEHGSENLKDRINQAIKDDLTGSKSHTSKVNQPDQSKESEPLDDDEGSDAESWESDEEEQLSVEECLFCSHASVSLEENVSHMTVEHSFFIPDAEYLIDLEGLILYLGEKISVGNVCLWCNSKGKAFHSTTSVQRHMVDKGHCKMLHEGDAVYEYSDFYDYRSSYPDFEVHEGGAVGGDAMDTADDADKDEEEDTVEEASIGNYELVLPSGVTIGHRSLARYYRQNIPPRRVERTQSAMPKVLAQYRALGWTGTTGQLAKRKAMDINRWQRTHGQEFLRLGVNKNIIQKTKYYNPRYGQEKFL